MLLYFPHSQQSSAIFQPLYKRDPDPAKLNDGNIKNLRGIDIKLCLDFKRGNGSNLVDYDNLFKITFEPYNITFIRKSNHNDEIMDQIEKKIVATMNQFQVINTIFCSK